MHGWLAREQAIAYTARRVDSLPRVRVLAPYQSQHLPLMSTPDVVFKARVMSLTVLRLNVGDMARIDAAIGAEVARAPKLFTGLPVLIDTNAHGVELAALTGIVRNHGLVPVAVVDADPDAAAAAQACGLGALSAGALDTGGNNRPRSDERPAARIVDQPVRSGQQLYARGTDLIIRASVSHGAEVLADGCIHVYGALRGRALAGCKGETSARIFCQSMEAELLAIAGNYRVAEDMDADQHGQPAMVRLDGEQILIDPLSPPN